MYSWDFFRWRTLYFFNDKRRKCEKCVTLFKRGPSILKIKTSVFLHFVFEISVFNCQGAEFWIFVFEKCSYKKKISKNRIIIFFNLRYLRNENEIKNSSASELWSVILRTKCKKLEVSIFKIDGGDRVFYEQLDFFEIRRVCYDLKLTRNLTPLTTWEHCRATSGFPINLSPQSFVSFL